MSPREAIALAAVLIILAIAGILVLANQLDAARYHRTAKHAFADPDGEQFTAALASPPPPPSRATLADLVRVRDRLLELPPGPRPDDTRPIPHAVGTWGKTVTQQVDDMARKYLAAPR